MFKVCAERCDQCLFSPNRVVRKGRMEDILRACRRNDGHFICHKHSIREAEGRATSEEANVCCRGFYDSNPMGTNLMRIAHRLNGVRFVDWDGHDVKQEKEND